MGASRDTEEKEKKREQVAGEVGELLCKKKKRRERHSTAEQATCTSLNGVFLDQTERRPNAKT